MTRTSAGGSYSPSISSSFCSRSSRREPILVLCDASLSSTRSTEASFDERRACSEGLRSTFAGRAVCGRGGRAAMGGPLAAAPTGTSAAPEEEPADEPLHL